MTNNTNAEMIRAAREKLRFTQEEFARIFDVSPRTVIRWENGKSVPQGAAQKKVQVLVELLQNEASASELKEVAGRTDGVEMLRSIVGQSGSSPSAGRSGSLSGGWAGGVLSGSAQNSLSPALGLIAGATSLFGAYKLLRRHFAEETTGKNAVYETTRYLCPICGCQRTSELLHCTGMLADGTPCTFVVCKNCIYSSKEAHTRHAPTCNRIDIPSLEPLED